LTRSWLVLTSGLVLALSLGATALAGPRSSTTRPGRTTTPAPAATAPATNPSASLPAGWPADVPLYPGATLLKGEIVPNDAAIALNEHISFNSPDTCPTILGWYKGQLKAFKVELEEASTLILAGGEGKRNVSMSCQAGSPSFVLVNYIQLK
jgi:hypothetical protein